MMSSSKKSSLLNDEQIAYIKGCAKLQCAVWRITHPDPLSAIQHKILSFVLKEAIFILAGARERLKKSILKYAFARWYKKYKELERIRERRKAIIKLLLVAKEAKIKGIKSKCFQKWKKVLSVSEADILEKYGSIFKLLDSLKSASLKPSKKKFLANLKRYRNMNNLRKPAKKFFEVYAKAQRDTLRNYLNTWNKKAKSLSNLYLKRKILSLATYSAINRAEQIALVKSLKNWYHNAIQNDDSKGNLVFAIYDKWQRLNKINSLYSALLNWKRKINDNSKNRVLDAKKHILKHNLNLNAEDLINAMKKRNRISRRKVLLLKLLAKNKKSKDAILRSFLKKWFDQANKLKNEDFLRKLRLNLMLRLIDEKNTNLKNEILRKALNKWYKNTRTPSNILPNTKKAINLLRKATTDAFFQKLKEKMLKELDKEKFRSIMASLIRNKNKDYIHWWFCQWRKNARTLSRYNVRAYLLNQLMENREKLEKLRGVRNLKDKIEKIKNQEALRLKLIRSIFIKLDALNENDAKGLLSRALYKWKANIGEYKPIKERIEAFREGSEILQRFCWRTTHIDPLNAFSYLIIRAKKLLLSKILRYIDRNNKKDLLRKYLDRWRRNIIQKGEDKRLKRLFKRYLKSENIRRKLFEPYKDLVDFMIDFAEQKKEASKCIQNYTRNIKEIPGQIKKMKITIQLMKILRKYEGFDDVIIKSYLMEWKSI